MQFVRRDQVQFHKNSDLCTALEYPMTDKDINGAVIELAGRYPDKGRVTNLKCKELVYVISGTGKVVIEGNEVLLNPGDLVLIEPEEKYFFAGSIKLLSSCTPAWYPEQHAKVQ